MSITPKNHAGHVRWIQHHYALDAEHAEAEAQRRYVDYPESIETWGGLLQEAPTVYVVSVEDEEGTQYVLGPYTDRAVAESRAAQHKHSLRLAAWKAEGRRGHPDDPSIFAWVVELLPDGPPEHNPYEDAPIVVVGTDVERDLAAGLQPEPVIHDCGGAEECWC